MDASRRSENAKRSWRMLRTVAAWVFVALSLLSAALWVDSYRVQAAISCSLYPGTLHYGGYFDGVALIGFKDLKLDTWAEYYPEWAFTRFPSDPTSTSFYDKTFGGFNWERSAFSMRFSVPVWSLVLVSAAIAIALRTKPRLRFGLRDLLILTVLVAVTFGGVEALSRAYQGPYATGSAVAH